MLILQNFWEYYHQSLKLIVGKVNIVKRGYEKVPPMSQLCTDSAKQIQSFHPIELLEQLSNSEANGYLQVSHGLVYW